MSPSPRRATLIVNPAAGRAAHLAAHLPAIFSLLRAHGYHPEVLYTTSAPDSAKTLASEAVAHLSGLVLACGGDGTIHGVLQGLAQTPVPLGVLPLGTANALARNLGLPLHPVDALNTLLTFTPRRIPLGVVHTARASRYFLVMAGCGPDGALVHSLTPYSKARFGRLAYYAHAARLFLTRRWPAFDAVYTTPQGTRHTTRAVALMAPRIADLGGAFSGLTPHASLTSPHLTVYLLRSPACLSFPAWFTLTRTGLPNPWLRLVDATEIQCTPTTPAPIFTQADSEPLGPIPFTLRILPNALTLLMPKSR